MSSRTAPNPRDEGLLRVLGPWSLAAAIISMIIGAGIFAVPAPLYASVGSYGPLAFLVCGLVVGCVAICFAEGGSRVPTSGGVYGLVESCFGSFPAFLAGTLLWVACVLACGGVAAALADLLASVVPLPLQVPTRALIILAAIGVIAWINVGGATRGAAFLGAMTLLKLLPLLLFVVLGLLATSSAPASPAAGHPDLQGVGRAIILGVFAFIGMETPLCASGEVRRPNRSIPRALALAIFCTIFLYVTVQYVAQRLLGPDLATSPAPLADAMGRVHPIARLLMLVGAALSMIGYLGSDILGSPRQLFALARDGLMPVPLGRLHALSRAPHIAIACYASLAAVLALTGTFAELAVLATLAMAPLYMAGCAAAWVLARRRVAQSGAPLGFRPLGLAALLGMSGMLALIALGSRREILGLLGLLGLASLLYLLRPAAAAIPPAR